VSAPAKLHTNIADRLREIAMRLPLAESAGDSVAAYLLPADENLDARWIDGQTTPSDCCEYASPIRIGASPGGFNQHRVSNRPRYHQRFFPAARLFDEQPNYVLHAFTITDDLLSE
jgi:hypothetical protein